jgi:AcrR family transcriptional regulator
MLNIFDSDGKKADIINAGLELFASRGYDAVSVRDIARLAGVSEAALYKHFKGKEDMALSIFTELISDYTARLKQVEHSNLDAVEKLCRVIGITYDLYDEHPAVIRFVLLSQYSFWDRAAEEIKPHHVIKRILERGMEKGEIPKQAVYLWISVFTGIMLQPLQQYPYFCDVLPEFGTLKKEVMALVQRIFGKNV